MNTYNCIVLIGLLFVCAAHSSQRQRFIIVNEAPESVFFTIGIHPELPLEREEVRSGERRYFFPQPITQKTPYFLSVVSMFNQAIYTIRLNGDFSMSSVRSCHAYGELNLMRHDLVMQVLGAASIRQGIILRYTHDYRLIMELVPGQHRPHNPNKCGRCKPCH